MAVRKQVGYLNESQKRELAQCFGVARQGFKELSRSFSELKTVEPANQSEQAVKDFAKQAKKLIEKIAMNIESVEINQWFKKCLSFNETSQMTIAEYKSRVGQLEGGIKWLDEKLTLYKSNQPEPLSNEAWWRVGL